MGERKIEESPIFILSKISKLVDTILHSTIKEHGKISELIQLKSLIQSSDRMTCTTACHGIKVLVEEGFLSVVPAISMIMSILPNVKHLSPVVSILTRLLIIDMYMRSENEQTYTCPFDLYKLQHPFVTILHQYPKFWTQILLEIEATISSSDNLTKKNAIEIMRPPLLVLLCNPNFSDNNSKLKTWEFLISLLPLPSASKLLHQAIHWLMLENEDQCENNILILLNFHSTWIQKNLESPLISGLAPLFASQAIRVAQFGKDPTRLINVLINIVEFLDINSRNVILILLAEFISLTPSPFLSSSLRLCTLLLEKDEYNCFIKNMILSSLLQWQVFPSRMIASSYKDASRIFTLITNSKNNNSIIKNENMPNLYFQSVIISDSKIEFAWNITRLTDLWKDNTNYLLSWLSCLRSNGPLLNKFDLTLISLSLHENLSVCLASLDWLICLSKITPDISFRALSVILYRLTKDTSSHCQLALLRKLPDMSLDKRNVTLILHTLESLKTIPSLVPLVLNLYVKLWIKDDRSAPYLEKMLNISPNNQEMEIARAHATKQIAETRPAQMCSDLARIISETLNTCTNMNGELASSEALLGIAALCKAKIIDVISAWQTLAPRFHHEDRPRVIASLCEFFAVIPTVKINNTKFFDLLTTATSALFVYYSHSHPLVVKASLKALSKYCLDEIPIESLPRKLLSKDDHKKASDTMLSFVSSECWVRMIEICHPEALEECADLLGQWLDKQNKLSHSFQKEPLNLKYLPNYHIFKAMTNQIFNLSEQNNLSSSDIQKIRTILMVLNRDFEHPLPPIQWLPYLNNLLTKKNEIFSEHIIGLCARQAVYSPSARQCATQYISSIIYNGNYRIIEIIFDLLKDLGRSIQPDTLEEFIIKCLNNSLNDVYKELPNSKEHLKILLGYLAEALHCKKVHEVNRKYFIAIVKTFSDHLDADSDEFLYTLDSLIQMPIDPKECMNLWKESRIPKALHLSCAIAKYLYSQENQLTPLIWLNEIIDVVAPLSYHHSQGLIEITKVLLFYHKSSQTISKWLLELLGQTQSLLSHQSSKNEIIFFCDIFIILILIISGHDALSSAEPNSISSSIAEFQEIRLELFPHATASLLSTKDWIHLNNQILEWLHHMTKPTYSHLIDSKYSQCFSTALIHLKYINYFKNSQVWMRFIH